MQSWIVHYKNKYPGCRVVASESSIDVFMGEEHILSMQKGGDGQWHDKSEAMGLSERHDLSPIPKEARVHKVVNGKIGFDELAEERKQKASQIAKGGKIPSIVEMKAQGFRFDDSGYIVAQGQAPKAPEAPAADPSAGE